VQALDEVGVRPRAVGGDGQQVGVVLLEPDEQQWPRPLQKPVGHDLRAEVQVVDSPVVEHRVVVVQICEARADVRAEVNPLADLALNLLKTVDVLAGAAQSWGDFDAPRPRLHETAEQVVVAERDRLGLCVVRRRVAELREDQLDGGDVVPVEVESQHRGPLEGSTSLPVAPSRAPVQTVSKYDFENSE